MIATVTEMAIATATAEFIDMVIVMIAELTAMIIAGMTVMTGGVTVMVGAMSGRCTGTAIAGCTNGAGLK